MLGEFERGEASVGLGRRPAEQPVLYAGGFFGGLAHGASPHHELQYPVAAGLTPERALRAATATTARRFRLGDRGRIAEGLRADLLPVDGDPISDISDTLNTRAVRRRGTRPAA